jgi:hypothetical protein
MIEIDRGAEGTAASKTPSLTADAPSPTTFSAATAAEYVSPIGRSEKVQVNVTGLVLHEKFPGVNVTT